MCGIFGALHLNGFFGDAELKSFDRSLDAVQHRGPDGGQSRSFGVKSPEGRDCYLGHRRLSIIDLSNAGNQPMEDSGVWIVFNGEIFNYLELRDELKKLGHQFVSDSDTEVILKSYHQWGVDCFDRFNGMWAILLLDLEKQRLLACRDRFSIKPLYYLKKSDAIYFASELRQLELLGRTWSPDASLLRTFLHQGLQDHSSKTFIEGIHKVPAKSCLQIDLVSGEQKFFKYWDYREMPQVNMEEAVFRLRELLTESIRIRLRSDVEVGCLLSGGLDSSTIATLANAMGNPIRTFSVVSNDAKVSEEKFIDLLVHEKSLKNEKLLFDPRSAIDFIDTCLHYQEQPFGGASVIAQYMVYGVIKNQAGIKVVLSGQGGDEALMGYLKYFFFYLRDLRDKGQYGQLFQELFLSLLHRTAVTQFNVGQAKRYMPGFRQKESFVRDLPVDVPIWKADSIVGRQMLDLDAYSVPALTHFEDRNSMAHSIESRTPFLDHHLVNFLVQLPSALKYRQGWSKYLLREAFPELPTGIRWRRDKKGFTVPEDAWCRGALRKDLEQIGRQSALADLGIIEPKKFSSYYKNFLKGDWSTNSKEIFSTLIAERWLRSKTGVVNTQ